jgi:MFS family permease
MGAVRRDLARSLGDATGYGLMAGIVEVYLPAFALAIGMAPVLAGLVATVPLLAGGLLQLLAPRAIARTRSLSRWTATCTALQALALVPLIVLALRGGPPAPIVFAAASLYWAAGMGAAAGWTPWMSRVVPARIRSRFFGRRQGVVQASMLAGLLGTGLALGATGGSLATYAVLFGVALVARIAGAFAIAGQGRSLVPCRPPCRVRLRSIPPRLRGTPRARLLGYLLAALAATAISGPFLTPYLLVRAGMSYAGYCVFSATIVVVKIIALPAFGRLIPRAGLARVLSTCALAIAPVPLMWAASTSFAWLLATQVYAGVAWAGFELAMLMALLDAADDAERTAVQAAFSALQAFGTAGASLIGGAVLAAYPSYTVLFVASAFARLAAAALVVHQLPRAVVGLPVAVARLARATPALLVARARLRHDDRDVSGAGDESPGGPGSVPARRTST